MCCKPHKQPDRVRENVPTKAPIMHPAQGKMGKWGQLGQNGGKWGDMGGNGVIEGGGMRRPLCNRSPESGRPVGRDPGC